MDTRAKKTHAQYCREWRAKRRLLNPPPPRGKKFTIGQKVGRLTIVERLGSRAGSGTRNIFVLCVCECGGTVECSVSRLLKGKPQSCGCLNKEITRAIFTKHGAMGAPEYSIWKAMRKRCNNRASPDYPLYGGRGIAVCLRWDDFRNFLSDMGARPSPKHSIDRINNDGNYAPDNCRWATALEQAANRRPRKDSRGQNQFALSVG